MKRPALRLLSFSVGVPLVLLCGIAVASKSGDARARAEAALAALSSVPSSATLARGSIEPAKRALARADDARAAGDHPHAAELEDLALEHAQTGVDLTRAADAEKKLAEAQKELSDLETKITRARALLEETVARRGRARAKLDTLEKPDTGAAAPPPAAGGAR